MVNILTIDPGLSCGWSTLFNGQIESGVQYFEKKRGESNGMIFMRFNQWLNEFHVWCENINLIVYEQAHHRGGYATEMLVNMTGRIQEFATKIGAECQPVHTGTLKKAIYGHGKASKEDACKWFTEKEGFPPIDDNHADAYALLMYAIKEFGD